MPDLPPLGTSRAAGTLGRATEATLQLRACLRARGADLVDLAGWLGGPRWEGHARDLVAAMLGGEVFTRRTRTLIEQSWRLFSLRHVHGAEDGAAGRFVCIDPRDPRVERCCEYADLLERTHLALATVDIAGRRVKRRVYRPARRAG